MPLMSDREKRAAISQLFLLLLLTFSNFILNKATILEGGSSFSCCFSSPSFFFVNNHSFFFFLLLALPSIRSTSKMHYISTTKYLPSIFQSCWQCDNHLLPLLRHQVSAQ